MTELEEMQAKAQAWDDLIEHPYVNGFDISFLNEILTRSVSGRAFCRDGKIISG